MWLVLKGFNMKFELSNIKFNVKGEAMTKPRLMTHEEVIEQFEKAGYSVPTLIGGFGSLYYCCDRDPEGEEPDCYQNLPDFLYAWLNQTDHRVWWCRDNANESMKWQTHYNGIARSSSAVPSPALDTIYTNDLLVDIKLRVAVSLVSTLLTTAVIEVKIDGVTEQVFSISGLAATVIQSTEITVPAGSTFQIADVSGASNSLVLLRQLLA